MKTNAKNFILGLGILTLVFSCNKKGEMMSNESVAEVQLEDNLNDDAGSSYILEQKIEGKEFIKKADIDLEVEDVFKTSVDLENKVKNIGGYVLSSNMYSFIKSEKKTPISDSEAELVRVYTMANDLLVSVPTEQLSDFLEEINKSKVFLNSRIITAEDVSANLKMAQLEKERVKDNEKDLTQLKDNNEQYDRKNENRKEKNDNNINEYLIKDELKYSKVSIHLKEPNEKIAVIKVANTSTPSNLHFWHQIKESFVDGYHGILLFFIYLSKTWAFILIAVLIWFGVKKLRQYRKK